MKRRIIALLVAVVMVLAIPVSAAGSVRLWESMKPAAKAPMDEGYVYCGAQSQDPAVVLGGSTVLQFKRRIATPSANDTFIVQIYRGAADQLVGGVDLPLIEERSYKMSQFAAPGYTLGVSFKADSRYRAGTYAVLWGIRSPSGTQYEHDYDYVMDMYIVNTAISATGIGLYNVKHMEKISVGQTGILAAVLEPYNATTARNFTVTSSLPGVATVSMDAGYIYVRGVAVGMTDIVVRCGSLEQKVTIGVGTLDDFTLTPGKTELCVGLTDTIRAKAAASGTPYYTWSSSDPQVASVSASGVVTAR